MKTIYVDFDGVLNSYKTKFNQEDPSDLPDDPVPGAIEWLCEVMERFHVVIFSCRMLQPEGEPAIHNWLFKHGMPNQLIDRLAFSCTKRGAEVYIDDRAWQFQGVFPTIEELESFKPWNKQYDGSTCGCSPLGMPHSEDCKGYFGGPSFESLGFIQRTRQAYLKSSKAAVKELRRIADELEKEWTMNG